MAGFMGSLLLLILMFLLVIFIFTFIPVGLWISALAAGVKVGLWQLVGMRLWRVPPAEIVNPLVKAFKAGLDVGVTSWRLTIWPVVT